MKNLILPIAMNMILATTLNAQGLLPTPAPGFGAQRMTTTTKLPLQKAGWLSACHETLGANAPAGWLMDLEAEDLEIYVTPAHALVLVDRSPMVNEDGTAYLRKGLHGLGGTHLSLIGEVDVMNDSVLHGVYSGLVGGTAVLMDQYVQLRNGMPLTVVRVIGRVNGSTPVIAPDQMELVVSLMSVEHEVNEPALTKY